MTILVYDGTWPGFLSCVFEAYERKLTELQISSELRFQASLLDTPITIITEEAKARRVWSGLQKRLSGQALRQLYHCFLSEIPMIENTLFEYIRLAFAWEGVEKAFTKASVLRVSQVAKMVYREKHRMEAFVRFQLTTDGIYYATIEPDFNVLPILRSHFEKRYADQKWLIYDLRRKYGIFYDLEEVEEIQLERGSSGTEASSIFSEDEAAYQTLWKDYFEHVNIKERKNMKLHLRHVPRRYWKYLTEKAP
ncbi:TIGR03915 family putative DNA repair protein [Pedobacter sp. SYSU D00535]|uniref:TIGR03915 family putative DNA repair protein n=1 Tax=Pedobacter sp. SYSU D00535 TaxID=2810308 RepID=UPI001A96CCA1|nr:TIGR03915 family putative DNA repair protein [Pedobacter sp. SYSU D00535]